MSISCEGGVLLSRIRGKGGVERPRSQTGVRVLPFGGGFGNWFGRQLRWIPAVPTFTSPLAASKHRFGHHLGGGGLKTPHWLSVDLSSFPPFSAGCFLIPWALCYTVRVYVRVGDPARVHCWISKIPLSQMLVEILPARKLVNFLILDKF